MVFYFVHNCVMHVVKPAQAPVTVSSPLSAPSYEFDSAVQAMPICFDYSGWLCKYKLHNLYA